MVVIVVLLFKALVGTPFVFFANRMSPISGIMVLYVKNGWRVGHLVF